MLNISGESSYHLVEPVYPLSYDTPKATGSSLLTNCSLLYTPKIVSMKIDGGYANISSFNPTNDEMLSRDSACREHAGGLFKMPWLWLKGSIETSSTIRVPLWNKAPGSS